MLVPILATMTLEQKNLFASVSIILLEEEDLLVNIEIKIIFQDRANGCFFIPRTKCLANNSRECFRLGK